MLPPQELGNLSESEGHAMRLLDYGPAAKERARALLRKVPPGGDCAQVQDRVPRPHSVASWERWLIGTDPVACVVCRSMQRSSLLSVRRAEAAPR